MIVSFGNTNCRIVFQVFLKKDGVIIIGLYNKYYRIRTNIRRFLYSKIRNKKIKNLFIFSFDPILRQLKKNLYKNTCNM